MALVPLREGTGSPTARAGSLLGREKEKMGKGKMANPARRREQIAVGVFPWLSPSLGGEVEDAPAPRINCWAKCELGNSHVSPHSLHSSLVLGLGFFGGCILGLDQNLRLAPSRSASAQSRAVDTRVPSEAPEEAGRSQPGKDHPLRTCPGFPARCHQHWEGFGYLWSSLGCFCRSPHHVHHPKLGTSLHRPSSPRCNTSLCPRDHGTHEVSWGCSPT